MGSLICFSGLDGSGKSTQAMLLSNWLNENGLKSIVYHTKNIGFKKNDVMMQTLNYMKNKDLKLSNDKVKGIYAAFTFKDIIENTIVPELEKNDVVIIDRYLETQYFIYKLQGIDSEYSELILSEIIKPEINFLIDVSAQVCYERISSRDKKIMEHESLENLQMAYKYYNDNVDFYNFVKVDGNREIKNINNDIIEIIKNNLDNCFNFT